VAAVNLVDTEWVEFQRLLHESPGVVVTVAQRNGNRYRVAGLRDPLAADPDELLRQAGLSAALVQQQWQPYRCLDAGLSFQRIQQQVSALPSVQFAVESGRLVARGQATADWIRRLCLAASILEIDELVDFTQLVSADDAWAYFLTKVEAEPGLEVLGHERNEDGFVLHGRRDVFASDPNELLRVSNVPASLVACRWDTFVSLEREIVQRRVRDELAPPETVTVEITDTGILKVTGKADPTWIHRTARIGPIPGISALDLSELSETEEDVSRRRPTLPQ
jgi:hypothetical protein